MISTVRYGLKLAAGTPTLLRPPPHLLRRPLFASTFARAYRIHPALRASTSTPALEYNYTEEEAATEDMDVVSESIENAPSSSHNGAHAKTEADLSTRPPPRLRPGDSFGSDFYGELNNFSLESPDGIEHQGPVEAGVVQNEAGEVQDASAGEDETELPLELLFQRKPLPEPVAPDEIPDAIPPSYWSHRLYHGPDGQDVIVDYCNTFQQSESIAQQFLDEPVLGFDMEWDPYAPADSVKSNCSVMQLACQDRIAIFHLSLHEGDTIEGILPPSLREIIESERILKAGVSINRADGSRLRKYLKLTPKGLFELSHMNHLLANKRTAGGHILKTLRSMDDQVQEKLGIPLHKGPVRMSDWSKPLNQAQIHYAAADAYAGFMLYHIMNEERKQMKPTPPHPPFAESGLPIMGLPEEREAEAEDCSDGSITNTPNTRPQDELQGSSLLLYEALCTMRTKVAAAKGMKYSHLGLNSALARVATAQPRTVEALRQVKGMGDVTVRNFGAECMATIERFLAGQPLVVPVVVEAGNIPNDVIIDEPITSAPTRKKQSSSNTTAPDASSQPLYDALREKRKEIAKEKRVPDWQLYRVATNNMLQNIAIQRPKTLDELRKVDGVGDWSSRQYGLQWLSVVHRFPAEVPEEQEEFDDDGSEGPMSEEESQTISAENFPRGAEGCLAGQHVVFTGILDILGRTGAQDLATKCGAGVMEKPTSETTLVVTGRDVSEHKLHYIEEYGLQTVSEVGFLAMVANKAQEARAADARRRAQRPLAGLSALVGANDPITAQPLEELPPSERPFHNALRAFRTQLASLSQLPAASICSDTDLRAIALAKPLTRANFLRLPGGRGLDDIARRCNKSVSDFLAKHGRSVSAPSRTASGETVRIAKAEALEGSDEDAFEAMSMMAPVTNVVYGEFVPPPSQPPQMSRKRKF